jgi:hypothetical protein
MEYFELNRHISLINRYRFQIKWPSFAKASAGILRLTELKVMPFVDWLAIRSLRIVHNPKAKDGGGGGSRTQVPPRLARVYKHLGHMGATVGHIKSLMGC